jgi:hypothetical protein
MGGDARFGAGFTLRACLDLASGGAGRVSFRRRVVRLITVLDGR